MKTTFHTEIEVELERFEKHIEVRHGQWSCSLVHGLPIDPDLETRFLGLTSHIHNMQEPLEDDEAWVNGGRRRVWYQEGRLLVGGGFYIELEQVRRLAEGTHDDTDGWPRVLAIATRGFMNDRATKAYCSKCSQWSSLGEDSTLCVGCFHETLDTKAALLDEELPQELRQIYERLQQATLDLLSVTTVYKAKHVHPPAVPLDRKDPAVQEVFEALDRVEQAENERDAFLERNP